jgi:hypothetical protein
MRLILKFNLVFVAVFLVGLGAAGYVSNHLLQQNAREEVLDNARLVMEAALAARAYTSAEIRPLLVPQLQHSFLPQVVAAAASGAGRKKSGRRRSYSPLDRTRAMAARSG